MTILVPSARTSFSAACDTGNQAQLHRSCMHSCAAHHALWAYRPVQQTDPCIMHRAEDALVPSHGFSALAGCALTAALPRQTNTITASPYTSPVYRCLKI